MSFFYSAAWLIAISLAVYTIGKAAHDALDRLVNWAIDKLAPPPPGPGVG